MCFPEPPVIKRAMASADGGEVADGPQESGGSAQAVPIGSALPVHDGGQLALRDGGQLALRDGGQLALQMPERLTIGTKKAFQKNYPFPYQKKQIGSETIYVCTKGSEWARPNEVLVLRCERGMWTAFDSAVSADGVTLQCRQPVFRCLATDITQPGWHQWQTNYAASPTDACLSVDWQGALWAETRVP